MTWPGTFPKQLRRSPENSGTCLKMKLLAPWQALVRSAACRLKLRPTGWCGFPGVSSAYIAWQCLKHGTYINQVRKCKDIGTTLRPKYVYMMARIMVPTTSAWPSNNPHNEGPRYPIIKDVGLNDHVQYGVFGPSWTSKIPLGTGEGQARIVFRRSSNLLLRGSKPPK